MKQSFPCTYSSGHARSEHWNPRSGFLFSKNRLTSVQRVHQYGAGGAESRCAPKFYSIGVEERLSPRKGPSKGTWLRQCTSTICKMQVSQGSSVATVHCTGTVGLLRLGQSALPLDARCPPWIWAFDTTLNLGNSPLEWWQWVTEEGKEASPCHSKTQMTLPTLPPQQLAEAWCCPRFQKTARLLFFPDCLLSV